jgi:hypothetical protein
MAELWGNLISYQGIISFLETIKKGKNLFETKKKAKNFFDTLRTRHKFIHKPIIKSPINFSIKEAGIKIRSGRSVFYLKEIIPYLEEIIRLHDEEKLSYKQIEGKLKDRKRQLDELRELEFADDHRVKPSEFLDQFEIAKLKLKDHLGWTDNSKEMQFLNYISTERKSCGRKFYALTQAMRKAAEKEGKIALKDPHLERERLGRRLDFCHEIMDSIIGQFKQLLKQGDITMKAEDWKEVFAKINKEE